MAAPPARTERSIRSAVSQVNMTLSKYAGILRNRIAIELLLVVLTGASILGADMPASKPPPDTVTPTAWLKVQPKPKFRPDHTLSPLTRFGWTLPFDARVELTENWGYALEFGGYADDKAVEKALADPESDGAKLMALCASDPKRYPLAVICSRQLPDGASPDIWTRDANGKFLDGKAQSLDGTEWHPKLRTIYSPESPDAFWRQAGELRAEPLRRIRAKCPIAIVLNGGEYGVNVLGFAQKVWEQDPRIVKAKGDRPWFDYLSERKAHGELLIAESVRKAVPDRTHYVFYTCGGGTHRNVIPHWRQWCHGWEWMKNVSDLPNNECYYRHFNDGWAGKQDMLTLCLNATAREIADGRPLSYNWLCAGWTRAKFADDRGLGDIERWTGFLKCYYTAGMIGANAGYYELPKGGFGISFDPNSPPHWLCQLVCVAHVHALFSHLEDFLREGDLLPGPDKHRISKDLPACEFPTGDDTVRVLARKHRQRAEWLITTWAAGGDARDTTVTIPELGKITLRARPNGAVYRVTVQDGKPSWKQADQDDPVQPVKPIEK